MPSINDEEIDLGGAGGGFEALPSGRYAVTLFKHEVQEIDRGEFQGKNRTALQLKVDATRHPNYKGRILFDGIPHVGPYTKADGTESQGHLWRYRMLLEAIGVPPQQREKIRPSILEDYYGTAFEVEVATREFEGKTRNDVKKYFPASGLAPSPVTAGRGKSADPFKM